MMNIDPNNVNYIQASASLNRCQIQLRHLKNLRRFSMMKLVLCRQEANILQLNTTPNSEQKLQRLQHLSLEVTGELNVLNHDIKDVRGQMRYLLGIIEIGRTTPLIGAAIAGQALLKQDFP